MPEPLARQLAKLKAVDKYVGGNKDHVAYWHMRRVEDPIAIADLFLTPSVEYKHPITGEPKIGGDLTYWKIWEPNAEWGFSSFFWPFMPIWGLISGYLEGKEERKYYQVLYDAIESVPEERNYDKIVED